MPVIHPGLFMIMQLFPDRKDALRQMYATSEAFRTICRDFRKCTAAIEHWKQSEADHAEERFREYLELRQSLESEIRAYIDTHNEEESRFGH